MARVVVGPWGRGVSVRYDTTVNCTPDNPLTLINRGPIKVRVLYENIADTKAPLFVELRLGKRRQRTALTSSVDHSTLVADVLSLLGFQPELQVGTINWDDDYGA